MRGDSLIIFQILSLISCNIAVNKNVGKEVLDESLNSSIKETVEDSKILPNKEHGLENFPNSILQMCDELGRINIEVFPLKYLGNLFDEILVSILVKF